MDHLDVAPDEIKAFPGIAIDVFQDMLALLAQEFAQAQISPCLHLSPGELDPNLKDSVNLAYNPDATLHLWDLAAASEKSPADLASSSFSLPL
jgi:hypothetical protein